MNFIIIDNKNKLFYPLLGEVISNKEIAELLGRPLWNDEGKLWFVAFTEVNAELVGCSAISLEGDTAYFRSSYVKTEYRREGVYSQLFDMRTAYVKENTSCTEIRASATEMSKPKYEKENFEFVGMDEGKYYLFKKEI